MEIVILSAMGLTVYTYWWDDQYPGNKAWAPVAILLCATMFLFVLLLIMLNWKSLNTEKYFMKRAAAYLQSHKH